MIEEPKKTHRVSRKIILVVVVLLVLLGLGYFLWKHYDHNKSSKVTVSFSVQEAQANAKALAKARAELEKNPNDPNAIATVASLTSNKTESKQLYAKLLTIYQNDMQKSTPTPTTYLAEANLAVKAGEISLAKTYYHDAINAAATSNNSYNQSIAQQAQAALKELQ